MDNECDNTSMKGSIFDAVFHTLAIKMPWIIIPLINHVFGMNIPMDAHIIQLRNEFYEREGRLIRDLTYLILDRIFHFECQSYTDSTMALRMFRYDASIALENAVKIDGEYYVNFPDSAVIYLRHGKNTPDEHFVNVRFSDGVTVRYRTNVIKVQNYTKDTIFEENLLLFLPFYIMRYENSLNKYTNDKDKLKELLHEFEIIRDRLAEELSDRFTIYDDLIELIVKISDHILRKQNNIRERMRKLMGVQLLELHSERMARIAKEKMDEGLSQGIAQGIAQGMAQGIAQGSTKKAIEIITNMLKADLPLDIISSVTDYSIEEILRIRQNLAG